jgi:spermidine/putrescine transport system ATP-binding protein
VQLSEQAKPLTSGPVVVSVRPEKIQLSLSQPGDQLNWCEGRLQTVMYLGTHIHCLVELTSGDRLTVLQPNNALQLPTADVPVYVSWGYADCLALAV